MEEMPRQNWKNSKLFSYYIVDWKENKQNYCLEWNQLKTIVPVIIIVETPTKNLPIPTDKKKKDWMLIIGMKTIMKKNQRKNRIHHNRSHYFIESCKTKCFIVFVKRINIYQKFVYTKLEDKKVRKDEFGIVVK